MFWRARSWLSTNVQLGSKIESREIKGVAPDVIQDQSLRVCSPVTSDGRELSIEVVPSSLSLC